MLLSLLTDKYYTTLHLPERCEGRFVLCDPEDGEALFAVEGADGGWRLTPCGRNSISDPVPAPLTEDTLLRVRIHDGTEPARLYVDASGIRYAKYARCTMPDDAELTVGYDRGCELPCNNPRFAARHCKLTCRRRRWSVRDLGSELGTYVNNERIGTQPRMLQPGDVISVLNQKFIALPGLLAMNAQSIHVDAVKHSMHSLRVPSDMEDRMIADEQPIHYFHRQLRFTSSIEEEDFNVAAPPSQIGQKDQSSALLTYGPAMTSGLGMMLGGMNPFAGIGMLAGTLIWPQLSKKRNEKLLKEEEEKRQAQYKVYLDRMEKQMAEMLARQENMLRQRCPRARDEIEALLRDNRPLWGRRHEQSDFLSLRLGVGNIPAKANITFPNDENSGEEDPMRRRVQELAERPLQLEQVPITLELSRFYNVGIAGPEAQREALALSQLIQLTSHVGYDDLKLCLLGKLSDTLKPLRWLPHTWNIDRTAHYLAGNSGEVDEVLPLLDSLLAPHRKSTGMQENRINEEIVFLITEQELANSGLIRRLLFDGDYERVHIITLAEHGANLPTHASSMAIGIREHHGRMRWQDGANNCLLDFTPDAPLGEVAGRAAALMANTRLDLRTGSKAMPGVVPFMDMFDVRDAAHLNLLSRWETSDPIRSLRAPIGVSEDGNLCLLDLHEKGDGPHGLIAGTTGSGKSELIMSYILSMAVSYSPEEVAFVLIDYKGGGMAQAFENLPHTAGIITNLDGNEINRSLMSIESELQRRQRVFSDTERALNCRKLDIYGYQRFYREGKVTEPMPHLIVITDEFAELKTQQPEFLAQLIRAARIGRSLGVHLILATQKPAGVVDDQIWSNSNFRLCLRVQNSGDSQEMLKCPDAAMLTNVGSFYKQVGYGETMQKAQSAWTGAAYTPESEARPDCAVSVLAANGSVLRHVELPDTKRIGDNSTQVEAVTEYIAGVAKREGRMAKPLWQPVLEETIPLDALRVKYGANDEPWVLNPVLGELDDPANQQRALLRLPISDGKNSIIYGGIGSGKLMVLTTLLEDLLRTHDPSQLNIYILDYADEGLSMLKAAPQVGDVLASDEDEKFMRLLHVLQEAIADRKKKLAGNMENRSLQARLGQAGLPNILVVLHHLNAIKQRHDDDIVSLLQVIGEGPRYGVYFIGTEENTNFSIQMQDAFPRKLVLQMNQEEDYSSLLGRTNGFKPTALRGRGLFRDEELFEFQTATADEKIGALCERLAEAWDGPAAEPIRILPEHVEAETLLPFMDRENPLNLPIGLDVSTIRPICYSFDRQPLNLIMGTDWDMESFLAGLLPLFSKAGIRVTTLDPTGITEDIEGVQCVTADGFEAAIDEMWDDCVAVKAKTDAGESLEDRPRRLITVLSPAEVFSRLSKDGIVALRSILEKHREEWNWTFLICGSEQALARIRLSMDENDRWFKDAVSLPDGILLGSASGQSLFQLSGSIHQIYQDIEFPLGYVIRNSRPTRLQLVEGER